MPTAKSPTREYVAVVIRCPDRSISLVDSLGILIVGEGGTLRLFKTSWLPLTDNHTPRQPDDQEGKKRQHHR